MSQYSIEVLDLSKNFGKFLAVDHISFNVKRGEIFGFLGANGAGKSTTIKMLCSLLQSTSGTALVGGYDINRDSEKIKKIIGYMSQRFSLYEDLTVEENINFFGGIYGLSGLEYKRRKDWAIKMAGLEGREKSLTKILSGGWKQRLALGCAILHNPQIIFLDEPTGSVDPISRRNFWDLINNLSDEGTTVFVTTHFLDEAEYCNTVYLMHAGKIIAGDSPSNLKTEYLHNPMLEIECDKVVDAMDILGNEKFVKGISIFGTYLHIYVENEESGINQLKEIFLKKNISLIRIQKITPRLEDVFIHLIEKRDN